MPKEFTVNLTSKNRWDLWMFVYRLGGANATTRDQLRNLEAVCDTFKVSEIQARFEALAEEKSDGSISAKDFEDVACPTGAVDLKRLLEYLDKVPEKTDPALALRLLKLSDYLQDCKDRKPVPLAAVPDEGA